MSDLRQVDDVLWEIPATEGSGMRVPAPIRQVLGREAADGTRQVSDVAHNVANIESTHSGMRGGCTVRRSSARGDSLPKLPLGALAYWAGQITRVRLAGS
jgi:hypothetical protein